MRFYLLPILLFFAVSAGASDAPERVVFRTSLGDLVFALNSDIAPAHVAQVLKLVRSGAYNGTHFYRVHRGFVAQLSTVHDRLPPLGAHQRALLQPIPAEFSGLRHVRGVLSMAREGGDPNSAESSFSILLGPAPHLDRQYTIFGRLVEGHLTLERIERAEVNAEHLPRQRLEILEARVFDSELQLHQSGYVQRGVATSYRNSGSDSALLWPLFLTCIGLLLFIGAGRVRPEIMNSLGVLIMMIGCFTMMVQVGARSSEQSSKGLLLFLAVLMSIWMMGRFETTRR